MIIQAESLNGTTANVSRYQSNSLPQVVLLSGLTPLALACVGGNLDVIKKLVELGAVVTASEKSEIQPLHHAAAAGNTEIVKFLLDQGADLHATTSAGGIILYTANIFLQELCFESCCKPRLLLITVKDSGVHYSSMCWLIQVPPFYGLLEQANGNVWPSCWI